MLTTLEDVDWGRLTHAWGEASNLPSLLRAIETGGEPADAAISELYNTIWHQGTVYEATAPAVPFLGDLARSPLLGTEVRILLMALVFNIGRGQGYWQVHASGRRQLVPDDLDEQLRLEERCIADCRWAVQEEASLFLSRLDESTSPTLWITAATSVVVAGTHQRKFLPIPACPEGVGTFARAGLRLIESLVATGRASARSVRAVAELDEDLADYVVEATDPDLDQFSLDSPFVDVLVERICDSTWQSERQGSK